ncbi:MAG TPA: thiol:disulfide interchange protein DsbA/DsbL [Burkholderiales bacterium]|nr:thiol:disulfide interchange protein DsbA/DsbL [Burkholderiales bacterium]
MTRKVMHFILPLLMIASTAGAALVAGKDYQVIDPPVPTETEKKIEVLEFFYYGCPHCYELEPFLESWMKRQPKDVVLRPVPAVFRESWVPLTKTFYTLEALGELDRLHGKVFSTLHEEGLGLSDSETMFNWAAKHGVDRKKFADTYNSFAVQSKVQRAMQQTKNYRITGTPSIVVDGKYLTSSTMAGGHERLGAVLDELVAMARKENSAKTAR